jgi:hypothetical protein
MDSNVLTAIISASASAAVAITALILNARGFTSLENRITSIENRLDRRMDSIQADLKEFYRILTEHDRRIQRLEDKQ